MSKNELRSSGEPRSGGFANGACELQLMSFTVHSYILVGDFLSRMKICLHECRSGAPLI